MTNYFGVAELANTSELLTLVLRLGFNLVFVAAVIHGVYFRLYRNREYVFTYYLFNVITFCLCVLLSRASIELGFALGLFAIFGILRYRTEPIRIRDLTYLFIVIGLGILNALASLAVSLAELTLVNATITGATLLLELVGSPHHTQTVPLLYDNIKLLRPGAEKELVDDLCDRTGLDVIRVDVVRIDMLHDAAEVNVIYRVK